jgi:hypothetical protein
MITALAVKRSVRNSRTPRPTVTGTPGAQAPVVRRLGVKNDRRTASGEPTADATSMRSTWAFSCGVPHRVQLGRIHRARQRAARPRCMPRKRCWIEVNSRAACASVSAATTLTPPWRAGAATRPTAGNCRAIELQRLHQQVGREVRGERERQPQVRRQLRAVQAAAQQPDRHLGAHAGDRAHGLAGLRITQVGLSSITSCGNASSSSLASRWRRRARIGGAVGARGAAQAQVDASGVQRGQGAELLGHHQRRVVGQHHAARADADGRVPPATWPTSTAVALLATPSMLWCSASQ